MGPESGRFQIVAGFSQLATPVIKVGMLAEVVCLSNPFNVIPMVGDACSARRGSGTDQANGCALGYPTTG